MKIAIIHLSDLHILNEEAIKEKNINALLASLNVFMPFYGVILAFSGDIAANGRASEYRLATKYIKALMKGVIDNYNIPVHNMKVLLAPGNHDMNRDISCQVNRNEVKKWYEDSDIGNRLSNEILRMVDFYRFARQHLCFLDKNNNYFVRKILFFNNNYNEKFNIEANIINSAAFSSDDDIGLHYLPDKVFENIAIATNSPFVLTLMHHSPDWFNPAQKVKLQELLYARSNLVMYGHEHYQVTQGIDIRDAAPACIQGGGAWWNKGFKDSTYYAGIIDSISQQYKQYEFIWSIRKKMYEHQNQTEHLMENGLVVYNHPTPMKEYIEKILADEKHKVCENISRYFVFPSLQIDASDEFRETSTVETLDELVAMVRDSQQLMILGQPSSGKTTLAKMLLLKLIKEYTVLLCGTEDVSGKTQKI